MARYSILLYLAVHIIYAWWVIDTPANAAEFYSVVERNGTVVLCVSKGSILFSDRCAGDGRLTIVEPIREGTVVWRSVTGTVSLENETHNAQCALSHAKWDPKAEKAISTGRKITKTDRSALLKRLSQGKLSYVAELIEDDISAFALDLDNDGRDEIVFVASNLARIADLPEHEGKTRHFVEYAGILPAGAIVPVLFYNGDGDYMGFPGAIGSVTIKGVVSISPGTGELALLILDGSGSEGKQTLNSIPELDGAKDRYNRVHV